MRRGWEGGKVSPLGVMVGWRERETDNAYDMARAKRGEERGLQREHYILQRLTRLIDRLDVTVLHCP